jgi:hypothetical protein
MLPHAKLHLAPSENLRTRPATVTQTLRRTKSRWDSPVITIPVSGFDTAMQNGTELFGNVTVVLLQ